MADIRLRRHAVVQHGNASSTWRDVGADGQSLPWWGRPTETPAVFDLQRAADDLVHEQQTADTRDHEDHTFCGVMFDVRCQSKLPLDYVQIEAVWVRGQLGPMTVWATPTSFSGKHEAKAEWTKVYERRHNPSPTELVELKLDTPLRLENAESMGLYVHSGLPGDEGLVYDNQRSLVTHEDRVLQLLPGLAHLSNKPFGRHGLWGRPWRRDREFVGRLCYGVRWLMWKPVVHWQFPVEFRSVVWTLLMASRRPESPVYLLQDEVVLYILNKCMWDWFGTKSLDRSDTTRDGVQSAVGHMGSALGNALTHLLRQSRQRLPSAREGRSGHMSGDLFTFLEALRSRQAPQGQNAGPGAAGVFHFVVGDEYDDDDNDDDDEEYVDDEDEDGEQDEDEDDSCDLDVVQNERTPDAEEATDADAAAAVEPFADGNAR